MYRIIADGAAANNQSDEDREAGCGVVMFEDGEKIVEESKNLGAETNNTAEYEAIIYSLEILQMETEGPISVAQIISDSELIIKQIRGEYNVDADHLALLHDRVHELLSELDIGVDVFTHRSDSEVEALAVADRLAKNATQTSSESG